MSMQIRAIIVYGKNGKVRTLPFRLNDVNIITGKSGTGKTALSDIIDFHRQKEEFIPQAIKDTLPYFLGAVADTSPPPCTEPFSDRSPFFPRHDFFAQTALAALLNPTSEPPTSDRPRQHLRGVPPGKSKH